MTPLSTPSPLAPAPDLVARLAYPLNEFYAREGVPLPVIRPLPGTALPEPYRTLLVHERDMTPTLEAWFYSDIHIEVWGREQRGDLYFREVLLRLDRDLQPVEFGANKVYLARFDAAVRRLILDEYLPLGEILKIREVPHRDRPEGFFELDSDALLNRAFRLKASRTLYGRRNTILDPQGRPLSEIVEILPPL